LDLGIGDQEVEQITVLDLGPVFRFSFEGRSICRRFLPDTSVDEIEWEMSKQLKLSVELPRRIGDRRAEVIELHRATSHLYRFQLDDGVKYLRLSLGVSQTAIAALLWPAVSSDEIQFTPPRLDDWQIAYLVQRRSPSPGSLLTAGCSEPPCPPHTARRDQALDPADRNRDPAFSMGSGRVYRLVRSGSFLSVARKSPADRQEWEFFLEWGIWSSLRHPNIVGFLGVYLTPRTVVTEWMGKGSLAALLSSPDYAQLSPTTKMRIAMGIVLGMRHCHSCRIIHRNLSPSNVLLTETFEAKIDDFRCAHLIGEEDLPRASTHSPDYSAPEIAENGAGQAVDVFSFAIIVWEMMTGRKPFGNIPRGKIRTGIRRGRRPEAGGLHSEAAQFLDRCWDMNPASRPTFDEILTELRQWKGRYFPGADGIEVEHYVVSVLRSEQSNPPRPLDSGSFREEFR
jgi:hypothetical protein